MQLLSFLLLLLALGHNALANYDIRCGPLLPRTLFNKLTLPIRDSVGHFFHILHPLCPDDFTGTSIKFATWPQYSNRTHTHVSGFAYGLSSCGQREEARYKILKDLLGLAFSNVTHNMIEPFYYANGSVEYLFNENIEIPPEFMSFGASGANLSIATPDQGTLHLTSPTNEYGHFEGFLEHNDRPPIKSLSNETLTLQVDSCKHILPLKYDSQNFSALFVPRRGITIVSDIDDILRISEIWNPKQMLLNTFVRLFRPWRSMPTQVWSWYNTAKSIHFHYATDAPETAYRTYLDGISTHYPPGTFDFRPIAFDSIGRTVYSRFESIARLIETFPARQFILLGDTATGSVLSSYIKLAQTYPKQIRCVVLRDVAGTEAANWITPNAAALKALKKHVLFARPSQLAGFDDILTKLRLDPAAFEDSDCSTMLPLAETKFKYRGFLVSWAMTWWTLYEKFFTCFMLLNHRPHRACVFDRRPGTQYYWGGPPEPPVEED